MIRILPTWRIAPQTGRILLGTALILALGGASLAQKTPVPKQKEAVGAAKPGSQATDAAGAPLVADRDFFLQIELGGHYNLIRGVRFAGTGNTLVSASDDKSLRFWDPSGRASRRSTGNPLALFDPVRFEIGQGKQGLLRGVAVSPVVGNATDPDTGLPVETFQAAVLRRDSVGDMSSKEDRDRTDDVLLVAWSRPKAAPGVEAGAPGESGKPRVIARIDTGLDLLPAVAYSHDGRYLAVSGIKDERFCQIRVYDLKAPAPKTTPKKGQGGVATNPGNTAAAEMLYPRLVSAFPRRMVAEWIPEAFNGALSEMTIMDTLAFAPNATPPGKPDPKKAPQYRLAAGNRFGTVRVFDSATGAVLRDKNGIEVRKDFAAQRPIRALAWNTDEVIGGDSIAVGVEDQLYIWNYPQDRFEKAPAGNQVIALDMDSRGRVVAGLGSNNQQTGSPFAVVLWDRSIKNRLPIPARIGEHSSAITAVALSPDGKTVASGDTIGRIMVWDTDKRAAVADIAARSVAPYRVRWREDGSALAWTDNRAGEKMDWNVGFDLDHVALLDYPTTVPDWRLTPDGNQKKVLEVVAVNGPGDRSSRNATQLRMTAPGGASRIITYPIGEFLQSYAVCQPDRMQPVWTVVVATTRNLYAYQVGASENATTLTLRNTTRLLGFEQLPQDVSISADNRYLAATILNGTVQIWNLDRLNAMWNQPPAPTGKKRVAVAPPRFPEQRPEYPLLSLFVAEDGEWICWNNHSGYYAASAYGDERIGWHVNQGRAATGLFRAAAELKEEKYQPQVIAHIRETGDIQSAVRLAQNERANRAVDPSLKTVALRETPLLDPTTTADALAALPKISRAGTIVGATPDPARNGFVASGDTISVPVIVTSAQSGVLRSRFDFYARVNGVETPVKAVKQSEIEWLVTISGLPESVNRVSIGARSLDGTGNVRGEVRENTLLLTRRVPPTRPRLYVLAVGIGKYQSSGISGLAYPANDATAIVNAFGQQGGPQGFFDVAPPKLLTDDGATTANVKKALEDMVNYVNLPENGFGKSEDSLVVVYLSGHGISPTEETLPPSLRQFYMATHDTEWVDPKTNASRLLTTAIPYSFITQQLQRLKAAPNVLLLIDQCYSGGIGFALNQNPSTAALYQQGRIATQRTLRSQNFITFVSSNDRQKSLEHQFWKHGAFTYGLLKALNGDFGYGSSGLLRMGRVIPDVQELVEQITVSLGYAPQLPTLYQPAGSDGTRITLARKPVAAQSTSSSGVGKGN